MCPSALAGCPALMPQAASATTKATRQYLERHAEPEARLLDGWPEHMVCRSAVVIPAYRESGAFLSRAIRSAWFAPGTLLILVINQPDNDQDTQPQAALWHFASTLGKRIWQAGNLQLLDCAHSHHGCLLLVDRFNHPIPAKRGVGLARKIGTDLALMLVYAGHLATAWLSSTDADATLPDNYFTALHNLPEHWAAACYAFNHIDDGSAIATATQRYQRAMRYYVAGLRHAKSPYAFFTIGSTLAFRTDAYASVRGFPQRPAGEDFYLLNKLAKTGSIGQIDHATIQLEARSSDRVPFGTGMSAARILRLQNAGLPFCYYHPAIFTELKNLLQHFSLLWDNRRDIAPWLDQLPATSRQLLENCGLVTFVQAQTRQCRNRQQFDRQLHHWFDGLKTLQFIHGWRDRVFPDIPLEEAVSMQTFCTDC